MANALYAKGRQGFLEGAIAWLTDDIRMILIDTGAYTPNLATHDFLNDIPAGARISVSPALTGKTSTDGVADATDPVFTAVTGTTVEAIVVYKHTGSDATARLIAWLDTQTGLPFTPNGGDVTYQIPNDANRLFKL